MAKQRGSPDQRGMGAQSDFIAEQFVPSKEHQAKQLEMAAQLLVTGVSVEELARMFSIPVALLLKLAEEPAS